MNGWELAAQGVDHPIGIINTKRCLRQIGEFVWVGNLKILDVPRRFNEHDAFGSLSHGSDYFVVPFMSYEHDGVTELCILDGFQVHFGHERASGIDRIQLAFSCFASNLWGN